MSRFVALKYRDFRLLWVGCLISWTGGEMSTIALSWMLYQMTGSALALGTLGLMRAIPTLALTLIGGSIADQKDRRQIILIAQILLTIIAGVVLITSFTNTLTPAIIYASVFLEHIVLAFVRPARQSLIPQLVPDHHFSHAVQLTSTMWQTTVLLGPALGGFIMSYYGTRPLLVANVVSFIPFIISLLLMSPSSPLTRQVHTENYKKVISDGLRFVLSKRIVITTMLLDFFVTFFAMAKTLFPIYADQILHVGASGLGMLYSSVAVGGITAGVLMNPSWIEGRQGRVLVWSVVIIGVATMVFALSPIFILSCLALVVLGAADFISMNIRMVIRQLSTPDYLRGRVAGIHVIFGAGGPMLGEVEAGILATLIGTQFSVFLGGVLAIASVIIVTRIVPEIRTYSHRAGV